MKEPGLVADCVAAMASAGLPVSVKTRIGVDDRDDYDSLAGFVARVAAAGCRHFIVHARKAWLEGLSPHENRTLPPLRYDVVHRLRRDFPALRLELNGGLTSVADVRRELAVVDGVMIGRQAYSEPWLLVELDAAGLVTGAPAHRAPPTRAGIVAAMAAYADRRRADGVPLRRVVRHLLGLYRGQPGGRAWRRFLSERATDPQAGGDVLRASLAILPPASTGARAA
jgi:tRNA-dihydrouridine synthase A